MKAVGLGGFYWGGGRGEGAGGWLFFQSPLTLLTQNNDQAALLSRACMVLSRASLAELGEDKASPLVPGGKAWLG